MLSLSPRPRRITARAALSLSTTKALVRQGFTLPREMDLHCQRAASIVGARVCSSACRSSQHPQRGLIQARPPAVGRKLLPSVAPADQRRPTQCHFPSHFPILFRSLFQVPATSRRASVPRPHGSSTTS